MTENATRGFAWLCLLVMTLLMVAYHFLLANGIIGAFLGGYSAIVSAVLVVPALLLCLLQFAGPSSRFTIADTLMFSIFALSCFVGLLHFELDVARQNISTTIQMFVFYFAYRFANISKPQIYIALAVMTAILLAMGLGDVSLASYQERQFLDDEVGGYQAFATTYLLIWMLAVCAAGKIRPLLYVIGIVTLFYNGARTEMIVAFVAILMIEAMKSRRNAFIIGLGGLAAIAAFEPVSGWLITEFPTNRVSLLLRDLEVDQSWLARQYLNDMAWQVIEENPLSGDYAYYYTGNYAHNIISAWADFGVFGFALFLAAIGVPAWGAVIAIREGKGRAISGSVLLLVITCMASVAMSSFAKFYTFPMLGISLALYARYLEESRRRVRVHHRLPVSYVPRYPSRREDRPLPGPKAI